MASRPKVKFVSTDGIVLNPTPVDDLEMIFNAFNFMEEKEHSVTIDRKKCKALVESVKKNTTTQEIALVAPVPEFGKDGFLTSKSWDAILCFYESKYDQIFEEQPFPIEKAARLESWFIRFLEPPPQEKNAFERWYQREIHKIDNFISKYVPPGYKFEHTLQVRNLVKARLGVEWSLNHRSLIEKIRLERTVFVITDAPEISILPSAKTEERVVVDLNKALGRYRSNLKK